jgi:hypothetical protein
MPHQFGYRFELLCSRVRPVLTLGQPDWTGYLSVACCENYAYRSTSTLDHQAR